MFLLCASSIYDLERRVHGLATLTSVGMHTHNAGPCKGAHTRLQKTYASMSTTWSINVIDRQHDACLWHPAGFIAVARQQLGEPNMLTTTRKAP